MAMSRAVAAIKRARVVEAVADGATHEQAAEQAGYASRSGRYEAYWKAMDGRGGRRGSHLHRVGIRHQHHLDALQFPPRRRP